MFFFNNLMSAQYDEFTGLKLQFALMNVLYTLYIPAQCSGSCVLWFINTVCTNVSTYLLRFMCVQVCKYSLY